MKESHESAFHLQDAMPCDAPATIGQDVMPVIPEHKEEKMSATEENISPVPNGAALVQEVLSDQPVAEFKSSNLANNGHARLAKKLPKVPSSTDSLHPNVPFNAQKIYKRNFLTVLNCKLCNYVTNVKINLNKHMFSKHGLGKGFKCKLCDYSNYRKSVIDMHMFSKHGLGNGFPCEFCDYVTSNKRNLNKHLKSKHVLA